MRASSLSVAASSSERLRARSAPARGCGRRSTVRRGSRGGLISARSWVSNRLICSGPSSAASLAIAGARSAVIHPKSVAVSGSSLSSRSASMRAEVIMPRSPTSTSRAMPSVWRMTVTISVNATGSAVLLAKYPHRDRAACRVGEHPILDLLAAFLAVAGVAARGQLTAPPGHPRAGQIEQRHPRLDSPTRPNAVPRASSRSPPAGRPASPSRHRPRRCTRRSHPDPPPGWCRATRSAWTVSKPGRITRETISADHDVA